MFHFCCPLNISNYDNDQTIVLALAPAAHLPWCKYQEVQVCPSRYEVTFKKSFNQFNQKSWEKNNEPTRKDHEKQG